jgi:small subunit ribosomal protein S13
LTDGFQVFINGFSFTEATLVKRSLESFFGIGPSVSQRIMAKFYIHPWAKVGSLKNATVMDLTAELANLKIENDLRRQVQDDIRRLRDMGTYRGRRHAMGLPVRGQKTRTQVCLILGAGLRVWLAHVLMIIDRDCATVEQDRTRWYWKSGNIRWKAAYIRVYDIVQYASMERSTRYTFIRKTWHVKILNYSRHASTILRLSCLAVETSWQHWTYPVHAHVEDLDMDNLIHTRAFAN